MILNISKSNYINSIYKLITNYDLFHFFFSKQIGNIGNDSPYSEIIGTAIYHLSS